jgi:hypothetical protein
MSNLSIRDTVLALLADVERTVIELDKTRTQTALESYQSAKELLLDAVETVRAGGRIAE